MTERVPPNANVVFPNSVTAFWGMVPTTPVSMEGQFQGRHNDSDNPNTLNVIVSLCPRGANSTMTKAVKRDDTDSIKTFSKTGEECSEFCYVERVQKDKVKGCKWRFMREGGALRCQSHTQVSELASVDAPSSRGQSFSSQQGPQLHKDGQLIRA